MADRITDEVEVEISELNRVTRTQGSEVRAAEEFRLLIDRYGHWMAVRAVEPGQTCPCVRGLSEGPEPNCRVCHGDGKLYTDHIVRGRIYTPKPNIGSETHVNIGQMYMHSPTIVVEPGTVIPKVADFILELVIDSTTNEPIRPYEVRRVYKVVNVAEMRDLDGKIAFFQIKGEVEAWGHPE